MVVCWLDLASRKIKKETKNKFLSLGVIIIRVHLKLPPALDLTFKPMVIGRMYVDAHCQLLRASGKS